MKSWLFWLAAVLCLAAVPMAQGAIFEDVQIVEQTISAPNSISGTLDLVNPGSDVWPSSILPVEEDISGFDPATWQAVSGTFEVWVHFMNCTEKATVDLGSLLTEADDFHGILLGLLPFENETALDVSYLLEINSTGQLDWQITATSGCFEIECVALEVCATPVIPEPVSLVVWSLLGSLAVGIGWWRRRKIA
ncbi:MAG: hypothetical protein ABFC63_09220 [Thermoguttaceae bacterium]